MTPWTVACQTSLSMGFSRQEYCSGSSCPPPGNLPDPRIKPASPTSTCIGRQVLYDKSLGSGRVGTPPGESPVLGTLPDVPGHSPTGCPSMTFIISLLHKRPVNTGVSLSSVSSSSKCLTPRRVKSARGSLDLRLTSEFHLWGLTLTPSRWCQNRVEL